jgi:preprotein translocase subunit SecB
MPTPASDSKYDRFLESIEPFSVGLNSCSASLNRLLNWRVRKKKLRPVSQISSSYRVDWIGEEGFDVIGELRVTTEHPETKERILHVECIFEVHFHGEKPIRKEYVERFAQGELRVFVWPYFRQFVADTTGRMGIAPLLIPITVREGDAKHPSQRATKRTVSSAP